MPMLSSLCETSVKTYIPIYIENAAKTMDSLSAKLDQPEFDILEYTQNYSLLNICGTLFGIHINYGDIDKKLFDAIKK